MGVTLSIQISSPPQPEDRELLTGISMMVLAIDNNWEGYILEGPMTLMPEAPEPPAD